MFVTCAYAIDAEEECCSRADDAMSLLPSAGRHRAKYYGDDYYAAARA